jgi:hypothetical protein
MLNFGNCIPSFLGMLLFAGLFTTQESIWEGYLLSRYLAGLCPAAALLGSDNFVAIVVSPLMLIERASEGGYIVH